MALCKHIVNFLLKTCFVLQKWLSLWAWRRWEDISRSKWHTCQVSSSLLLTIFLYLLKSNTKIFFPPLGGRGEDSSVIITLPECSAFSDIPEEALAKVFTYLTLIPRYVLLFFFYFCLTLLFFLCCSAPKAQREQLLCFSLILSSELNIL